ncbi:hypothetical protein [Vibrio quintilis]|nr:hypothetical protein [Vibrio quintilis]
MRSYITGTGKADGRNEKYIRDVYGGMNTSFVVDGAQLSGLYNLSDPYRG